MSSKKEIVKIHNYIYLNLFPPFPFVSSAQTHTHEYLFLFVFSNAIHYVYFYLLKICMLLLLLIRSVFTMTSSISIFIQKIQFLCFLYIHLPFNFKLSVILQCKARYLICFYEYISLPEHELLLLLFILNRISPANTFNYRSKNTI